MMAAPTRGRGQAASRRLLVRARPQQLPMRTLADLDNATEAVSGALAEGTVVLDEVATLTGLIEARRRLLETTELERRLAALEQQQQPQRATAP